MALFLGILFLVVFVLFVAIGITASIRNKKEFGSYIYPAEDLLNKHLTENGFTVSKKQPINNNVCLYIDDTNKKWFIQTSKMDTLPRIYNFSDLIEFAVYEDGNSIVKGKMGSAIAGGLMFGVAGAVIGASGKRKISNTCTILQIQIKIVNLQRLPVIITLIKSETPKSSIIYKNMIQIARNVISTLAYIQNDGKKVDFEPKENKHTDELEKYFELKNKGIISEEEFSEKKKQLLGL